MEVSFSESKLEGGALGSGEGQSSALLHLLLSRDAAGGLDDTKGPDLPGAGLGSPGHPLKPRNPGVSRCPPWTRGLQVPHPWPVVVEGAAAGGAG